MNCLFVLLQAILVISGASSMEELDESVVEQFDHYSRHPLRINCVSESKLVESGLMSEYQAAALTDYRSRCGDVLSWSELAAVDGFGKRYSEALKEYISLESGRSPGTAERDSVRLSQGLVVRGMGRLPESVLSGNGKGADGSVAGGLKYSLELGERLEFAWSSRNTYSSPELTAGNFCMALSGTGALRRVITGDYGLRFGQGLLVWSGFSMSGLNSALALSRSGSGAYVSHSYSRMHHGAASEFSFGRWTATAALSFPDFKAAAVPVVNIKYTGRSWNVSATAVHLGTATGASADFRTSFKGLSLFGEVAWCGAFSVALGLLAVPRYGWTVTAQARHIPPAYASSLASPFSSTGRKNDEQGVSAALQTGTLLLTLDASRRISTSSRRYRALGSWHKEFPIGNIAFEPSLRASFLYRPQEKLAFKEDLRVDCKLTAGRLWASARYNMLWCRSFAWMCYAEAGYGDKLSFCARAGIFKVDNWDDRIYCYERDAPGNFNSIALYGRGWDASAYLSWKIGGRQTLYLRAFGIFYPGTAGREGYGEIRLQYSLELFSRTKCRFAFRPL